MDLETLPHAIEPDTWFIVFWKDAATWWLGLAAMGTYKHVSAFAYIPGVKAWVHYDAQWNGLKLQFIPHAHCQEVLGPILRDNEVIKIKKEWRSVGILSRLGFYCVPTVKHLLGVQGCVVRPDGLHKVLLRNGGVAIGRRQASDTGSPGRSEPGDRAGDGSE